MAPCGARPPKVTEFAAFTMASSSSVVMSATQMSTAPRRPSAVSRDRTFAIGKSSADPSKNLLDGAARASRRRKAPRQPASAATSSGVSMVLRRPMSSKCVHRGSGAWRAVRACAATRSMEVVVPVISPCRRSRRRHRARCDAAGSRRNSPRPVPRGSRPSSISRLTNATERSSDNGEALKLISLTRLMISRVRVGTLRRCNEYRLNDQNVLGRCRAQKQRDRRIAL